MIARLACLSLALLSVAAADAALAQTWRLAPATAQPPSDPEALQAWCQSQVFRRFGHRQSGGARILLLDPNQGYHMIEGCVRSKGATVLGAGREPTRPAPPLKQQQAAPKTASQPTIPPSEAGALQAWCRQQIFRRYGERVSGEPKKRQIEMNQSVMKVDACFRSKGRIV